MAVLNGVIAPNRLGVLTVNAIVFGVEVQVKEESAEGVSVQVYGAFNDKIQALYNRVPFHVTSVRKEVQENGQDYSFGKAMGLNRRPVL